MELPEVEDISLEEAHVLQDPGLEVCIRAGTCVGAGFLAQCVLRPSKDGDRQQHDNEMLGRHVESSQQAAAQASRSADTSAATRCKRFAQAGDKDAYGSRRQRRLWRPKLGINGLLRQHNRHRRMRQSC